MFLKSLAYGAASTGWNLEPIEFGRMTLLVGASGVGKTQILRAISNLRRISRGHCPPGVSWAIEFQGGRNLQYKWEGRYERKPDYVLDLPLPWGDLEDIPEDERPIVESEKLWINDELIIDRKFGEIVFDGTPTVKLSKTESALSLLKQEEKISGAHAAIGKVIFDDNTRGANRFEIWPFDEEEIERVERYSSLKELRESSELLRFKLFWLFEKDREAFEHLVASFADMFPFVERVKLTALGSASKKSPLRWMRQTPVIQIKESGVSDWVSEFQISSGMKRAFIHLAELYLCADSTLILIDEFENSLGINCIDEVTSSILSAERDMQFILTSHHPYIINKIDPVHWKLVTRKGSKVATRDMDSLYLSKSKQKAFTQLINMEEYETGVAVDEVNQ